MKNLRHADRFLAADEFMNRLGRQIQNAVWHNGAPTAPGRKSPISRKVCMDGCSNMQSVLQGATFYYNETQRLQHDACAGVCCNQYMLTLGCTS